MRRPIRRTSAALEELLDKDVADGTELSRVLAAARAPGTANEVVGFQGAKSAFMVASRNLPRFPVRHRAAASRSITARGFMLKALAAVSGVTVAGGVAFAATTTGFLGGPAKGPAHHRTAPTGGSDATGGFGGSFPDEPGSAKSTENSVAATHRRSARTVVATHAGGPPAGKATRRQTPTRPTHPASPTHAARSSHPASSSSSAHRGRSTHAPKPTVPPHPTRTKN
jgi:hypothetical protein